MIAETALRQWGPPLGFSRVLFVPAYHPPHRSDQPDLLDARHRLKMVQLATAAHPYFQVSDIEYHRGGCSYTIDTLEQLQATGATQAPVPFIIGSDALEQLARWHRPADLIHQSCFLQAPRPGVPLITEVPPAHTGAPLPLLNTRPIDMPLLALSSTWIRQIMGSEGIPPRYFVPEPVRQYIVDNGLYRSTAHAGQSPPMDSKNPV